MLIMYKSFTLISRNLECQNQWVTVSQHTNFFSQWNSLNLHAFLVAADFYPNFGRLQNGCKKRNILTTLFGECYCVHWMWFITIQKNCHSHKLYEFVGSIVDKCSHHRSHELFWETLTSNFVAIKCASFEEIMQNRCTFNNVTSIMGGDIISNMTRPNGTFYLETRDRSPFVVPDYKSFKNIEIIYTAN